MPVEKRMKSSSSSKKPSFIPRSILKTLGKLQQAFDPSAESKLVEEFRASQYRTVTSIRYLLILIIVPLLVNHLSKTFLINPLVEKFWLPEKLGCFLNFSQEERALAELKKIEQKIKFESLMSQAPDLSPKLVENKMKEKAKAVAQEYKNESANAVANIFAALLSSATFITLLFTSKQKLVTLKTFADDVAYGLSDSAKAFLIILFTNMFVGFHSTYGWEVILERTLKYFGLPENQDFIYLFIATFPVILDVIFKYWIFRYLNRTSPSAVATYHNMNE